MIVLKLIFWLLNVAIGLADAGLLVYVLLTYLRSDNVAVNRVRQALALFCEPLLVPARRLLGRVLPSRFMILDWSPLVVWVALGLGRNLLGWLKGLIL